MKDRYLTPFGLQFLAHCCGCVAPFQDPPSEAMKGCISSFTKEGLIYQEEDHYKLTTPGRAYLDKILATTPMEEI